MVEECTISVGFHSNFGTFKQIGHSKTPLKSTIISGIPFNPTYVFTIRPLMVPDRSRDLEIDPTVIESEWHID